jgi:hypothetical protein
MYTCQMRLNCITPFKCDSIAGAPPERDSSSSVCGLQATSV